MWKGLSLFSSDTVGGKPKKCYFCGDIILEWFLNKTALLFSKPAIVFTVVTRVLCT